MVTDTLPSAAQVLRDSPLPHLRTLDVIESEEEVVIRGQVASYYHKQLAQEAVLPLMGERRLKNLVIVGENEGRSYRP
ncbi:MAG: BON domain-containing protein [Gemmataceae bacterium]